MEDVLPSMLRLILHGDNRSNIHLLIALIGGILCFTPMYGNVVSNIETLDSVDVIHNGILFKCASAVSLTLAVLLLLDLLFDFMASMVARAKQPRAKEKKMDDDVLNVKEMLFFLAGIIILPMTSFFPFGAVKNFVMFTQMCSRAQMMFVCGAVLASLNRFDSKYFPTLITLGILVVFIVGHTIFPYYLNAVNSNPALSVLLYQFVMAFTWLFGIVGFLMCAYYIFDTVLFTLCGFKRWKLPFYEYCCSRVASIAEVGDNNGSKRPDAEKQPYTNGHIYFRLTYCMMIIVFILVRAAIQVQLPYPAAAYLTDTRLFMMLIPPILLAICILVFNLRLVKHEAVESLIALLDAKKSYVRYISHGTCSFESNKHQSNIFLVHFIVPFCRCC